MATIQQQVAPQRTSLRKPRTGLSSGYSGTKTKNMDYLIQKYGNTLPKKAMCECCGKEFETNINRLRCSKSCANIMKHRRKKDNHSFSVKYEKETTVKTTVDVFGFINRAIY